MNIAHKWIARCVALAVLYALAACGGGGGDSAEAANTQATSPTTNSGGGSAPTTDPGTPLSEDNADPVMPNVLGRTETEARQAIVAAGLTIGVVHVSGTVGGAEPTVTSTSHAPGAGLSPSTVVDLVLSTTTAGAQPPIRLTQGVPRHGDLVGDEFSFYVGVTSTYELVSAVASIAGRQFALTLPASGVVNIAGTPTGPHLLTVRVTDVRGNFAENKITVIHDARPMLTIVAPVQDTVALSTLPVDVTCTDDHPGCRVQVFGPRESGSARSLLAEGIGGVVAAPDVSRWSGQAIDVLFQIFDTAGQLTEVRRNILVETSSRLSKVLTLSDRIMDVDSTRVLTGRPSIYYRSTTAVEQISWFSGLYVEAAKLTSTGAVLRGRASDYYDSSFEYLWRAGVLAAIVPNGGGSWPDGRSSSFVVAGDYVVTRALGSRNVYRVNTVTGESLLVTTGADVVTVSPDGSVIVTDNGQLIRYRNGQQTVLLNDSTYYYHSVVTNGDTVVYGQSVASPSHPRRAGASIIEGTAAPVLITPVVETNVVLPQHQLAGDWLVYSGWGTQQQRHLFRRDPQRTVTRITDFAASSSLERLADNGDVMLIVGNERYLSRGTALVPVSSAAGRSYWVDGAWHIGIASTLLAVDASDLQPP